MDDLNREMQRCVSALAGLFSTARTWNEIIKVADAALNVEFHYQSMCAEHNRNMQEQCAGQVGISRMDTENLSERS